MRSRNWYRSGRLAGVLAMGCAALSLAAVAADKPGKNPQTAPPAQAIPSPEEMMAAYEKFAQPGPEHAALQSMAGSWRTVTKSWFAPGDPQVSEGQCKTSVILGGRFITDEFKGNFAGKPFEGFGLTGFDLYRKEYVSIWTDSMGTAIMMSKGKMDPAGKVLTMYGTFDDPVSGQKQTIREVLRFVDNDTRVFEMYGTHEGKEVKEMEVTYTRQ